MIRLIGGALVGLLMVAMIGKGVTSGLATSTEVSAFAVMYALIVGGLAFRELTMRSIVRLFVRSASMTGSILLIVAAASSVSYALALQQIPLYLSESLVTFAHQYGSQMFVVVSALLMIAFGAVLEGAPALIIFGPLLTPIAQQLGVNPLHFGTVMVIAMGLGLFSPPIGLGLFATCAITRDPREGRCEADAEVPSGSVSGIDGAHLRSRLLAVASVPHGIQMMAHERSDCRRGAYAATRDSLCREFF